MLSLRPKNCRKRSLTALGLLVILFLCSFLAAASSPMHFANSPQQRELQDRGQDEVEADEGVIDEEDEAAVMQDDNLEEEYQFDDMSLLGDHFDSQDFAPPPQADKVEEVPKVVYDDFGLDSVEEVPKVVYDDFGVPVIVDENEEDKGSSSSIVNSKGEDLEGEMESDAVTGSGTIEEVDVEEKAKELLKEAEEEEEEEGTSLTSSSTKPVPLKTYTADTQKKWVAHGAVGTAIFGLLVPSAISSAFFRDLIPGYWIYVHVILNVTTFALTFFTVGIAFATMNGMGDASEGHMKEVHHIIGLLLLLLVSFQTANGFLRPPREFITDDLNDRTPGAIHRSNTKTLTTRTIWYLSHAGCGLLVFTLGIYQVRSGMELFSKRFGTTDWGSVWLGYIFLVVGVVLVGKIWVKLRERRSKKLAFEMQTSGGEFNYGDDNSTGELGSLSFRQV